MGEITTVERLESLRAGWAQDGLTVAWTNGCYDLLHAGHVRNLREAKRQGDILIVGVNSDASVRGNKGELRPVIGEIERAEIVAALGCVDYVVIFDDKTPIEMLQRLKPDVHCKGSDYANGAKPMPEADVVASYGGRIAFIQLHPGCSTTGTIEKIVQSKDFREPVPPIDCADGASEAPEDMSIFARRIHQAQVLVVGDMMLDEYVIGDVARISPEAPVPIFDVVERRYTQGGAGNVAANLAALGARVCVAGLIGDDPAGILLKEKLRAYRIHLDGIVAPSDRQTICKTRFVAGQQQIIRVDHESRDPLKMSDARELAAKATALIDSADVCVLSDYAKMTLSEEICQQIISAARTARKAVIVDPKGRSYQKYRGCSVITPNTKEVGLATGIEIETEADLYRAAQILLELLPDTSVLVTRGGEGMTLFRQSQSPVSIRTVAKSVFDVVGAGDTAVATLSIALAVGLPMELAIKLANVAAGIAVEAHGTVAVTFDQLAARNETRELLQGQFSTRIHDVQVA